MSIWKNEHNIELYIWLSPPRYPSQWIVFISGYKSSYYQPVKNRTPKFVIHTHVNIFLKLRLCVLIKKIFFSKWSELVLNLMHFEKLLDFFFKVRCHTAVSDGQLTWPRTPLPRIYYLDDFFIQFTLAKAQAIELSC